MNIKSKLGLLSIAFVAVLGVTAVFTGAKNNNLVNADENYRIVLNADNTPTIDENKMALEATSRYVTLMYQDVEEAENAHIALLPGGLIANGGRGDHRFSGVKNITVVTDGIINLYGMHPAGKFDLLHTFTSEAPVYEKAINYYNLAFANADIIFDVGMDEPEITDHETKAVVTSLVIEYSCVDTSSITFGGTVVSAAGPVSGATVSITGTDLTAVTGADGKYVFENVFVPTFDFEVVATCPAYFEARATVNSLVTTKDLELIRHPYSDGNFISADHKARPFFTRSTTALIFDILDTAGLTADREYSIFITLDGNNDTSRVGSKVLEIKFKTDMWIDVWDYSINGFVSKPGVALSFNEGKTNARVTIPYNYINGINGYNIEPTEKVGVTFGAWVHSTSVWEGWKEGAWYADPLNPSLYLKIDANNGEHVNW